MRELVRRDQAKPAVVVLQPGLVRGRREQDEDAVGREHDGRAVGDVDVVHQRQVDHLARRVKLRREQPVGALGLPRRELRHVTVQRAKVDAEMGGVEGAPGAGRIGLSLGADGEQERQENADCGLRIAEYQ